jgi:predicted Fe-Mo cluster-binding NifX family protein
MKVLIPCTDATGTQSRLYIPYGEAPFFALWDSVTDQLEFQSNPLAGQAPACACSTTHWMQRARAGVLITADMGRRAAQRLKEAGIEVLHAPADKLGELLVQYRHGRLSPAPTGEPPWLCNEPRHTEHHAQHHAAHRRGGKGECCGAHEDQQSQGHHGRRGYGGCCHSA